MTCVTVYNAWPGVERWANVALVRGCLAVVAAVALVLGWSA